MNVNLHRILYLWAGVLLSALLLIIPLPMGGRIFGVLAAACSVAWAWIILSRRAERLRGLVRLADGSALPAPSFCHPVAGVW